MLTMAQLHCLLRHLHVHIFQLPRQLESRHRHHRTVHPAAMQSQHLHGHRLYFALLPPTISIFRNDGLPAESVPKSSCAACSVGQVEPTINDGQQ